MRIGDFKYVVALVGSLTLSCNEQVTCIDPTRPKPDSCNEVLAPVCGCNGQTYDNACFAQVAGLTWWRKGKCPR
ncbi:MAG: hypothetical protein KF803_16475 [Cyclobacteriaceae bacterium]|nr:hypothetical protein [Cyclobacteriaceae bacterium]